MKYSKDLVEKYSQMIEDWDNPTFIFDKIDEVLQEGDSILELGSGTGKDFYKLSQKYNVTGSDYSEAFLDLLGEKFLVIDARSFMLDSKYDLIYSNKVLQHFNLSELASSLKSQYSALKTGGYVVMTLWYGDSVEDNNGMISHYYNEEHLEKVVGDFKMLEVIKYKEMDFSDGDDSMLVVLKK